MKKPLFKPGDWIWVHFRKERFPNQWKSKFNARGDGPFEVNDTAYMMVSPNGNGVSTSFNVSNLPPFNMNADLRTNLFEEKGNDTDPPNHGAQRNMENNMGDPLVFPRHGPWS